jgi:sugar phosphate isomerase/epimerase
LNDRPRTRRTFLAAGAGAALLPALPRLAGATPSGPRGGAHRLKLGVASYSLRKFSLDQALEMCREMDVRYVNFKDVHMPMTDSPEALRAARKKVEAAGLTIMGGGTITLKNDPAQVRKAFQYAKDAGFPLMVTAPEPDAFDVIEKTIQEFDIKVAVHNHGPEDEFFPAPQDAMKKLVGRDRRFGLCMDIGHATRAGVDAVKTVDECKERLLDLHVKDLRVKKDKDSQTEVGKGALDIPGLFRALEAIGFAGHVGLEYEINETSPLVGMKESFSYMRGVLDAIEG